MTSRQRVKMAISHKIADKVPVDLGSSAVTGIHAKTLFELCKVLSIPMETVNIHEVFQQLGFVDSSVQNALGVDVIGLQNRFNFIGVENSEYINYSNNWNVAAKISKEFVYKDLPNGNRIAYPKGDKSADPSIMLLPDGYFYNQIHRQSATCSEERSGSKDFSGDYTVLSDDDAIFYQENAERLFNETELSVMGLLGPAGFGDAAIIPGTNLTSAPGIRNLEEWMMAHYICPDYIHEVFSLQAEIAVKNLEIYHQAVGNKIDVMYMGGTDFGTQNSLMISPEIYRELYKPYFKKVNDWVHSNTSWKTFYHSCGAVEPLINDFIEAGTDILNPVQCSAAGMEPKHLKDAYGDELVFWGGGIDTQHTLPFGTPEECYNMVIERLNIFSNGGGYIFNAIHNIQANTPIENIIAMFEALKNFNSGANK